MILNRKKYLLKKRLPWYCLFVLLIPIFLEIIYIFSLKPFFYSKPSLEELSPQFLKDYFLEQRIEKLPLEEKVGYLFMVGFEGEKLDDKTTQFFNDHSFKNFILFSQNIRTEPQVKSLIGELCKLRVLTSDNVNSGLPAEGSDVEHGGIRRVKQSDPQAGLLHPLIAVDQEGGVVNRVNFGKIDKTAQSEIATSTQAYKSAKNRGEILSSLGFNLNFAPVSEVIKDEGSYLGLSKRAFLGDADQVFSLSKVMVEGYLETGIIPVPKHFPGSLGRKVTDPHQDLTVIDLNQEELAQDIIPFQKLIKDGKAPVIMVTHILYPKINEKMRPASLSKVITTDLLRGKLGFKGVVVTDDLAMKAIVNRYEASQSAKIAILAGADLVILSSDENRQDQAYQGLLKAVREGEITTKRINESVMRLLKLNN